MKNIRVLAICGVLCVLPMMACAQTAVAPAPAGPAVPPALAPEARDILKMLEDRKTTLKDFTAKIDYSTTSAREAALSDKDSSTGKRGTLDFLMDPTKGPTFSADFTANTAGGKATLSYHIQFIFDGHDFTIKDFGRKNDVMQYIHTTLVPPGSPSGSAVSLSGALPLPIGLKVDDVAATFEVTLLPSKDPNQALLKLIPRDKTKFDYVSLLVTVDKTNQLPVKLVQAAANGDLTTIVLTDLKVNPGTAHLADASTPAKDGWVERK